MYKPGGKKRTQSGGQYITSTAAPSEISTPAISVSTLRYISEKSQVNYADIANLTVDQISSLIRAINEQISADEAQIVQLNADIAQIDTDISKPGGLNDIYTLTKQNYDSTMTAYKIASTNLINARADYDTRVRDLSSLGYTSSLLISSIAGYELEFQRLSEELGTAEQQLQIYESTYQGQLKDYDYYLGQYIYTSTVLDSTIKAMNETSTIASTVYYQYVSTSSLYSVLEADYIYYVSTFVSTARDQLISTQKVYEDLQSLSTAQMGVVISTGIVLQKAEMTLSLALSTQQYWNCIASQVSTTTDFETAKTQYNLVLQNLQVNPTDSALLSQRDTLAVKVNTLSTQSATAQANCSSLGFALYALQGAILSTNLAIADQQISTAQVAFMRAALYEKSVDSTIKGIEARILMNTGQTLTSKSRLSTLSSQYIYQVSESNRLSSIIAAYDVSENLLNAQLASTLSSIGNFSYLSTLYTISIGIYTSSFIAYSTLEAVAVSSISGYTDERTDVNNRISTIDGQITNINTDLTINFGNLRTDGANFYNYKLGELNAEVEEYEYSIREFNAAVGMTAADLLLRKMKNLTEKDGLTFDLISNLSLSTTDKNIKTTRITAIDAENTRIDSLLGSLNPLEISFNSILGSTTQEKTLKQEFIALRKKTFDTEVDVLETPTKKMSVKTQYETDFTAMNGKLTSIRAAMGSRDGIFNTIKSIFDTTTKTSITSILGGADRFPDSLVNITVNRTLIQDISSSPTAPLSDFSVLAPIDFTTV